MPSIDFYPGGEQDGYVIVQNIDCNGDPVPDFYTDYTGIFIKCSGEQSIGDPTPPARRGYLFFDTSSVPMGATITKIELSLYFIASQSIAGGSHGSYSPTYIENQTHAKSFYATAEDLFNGLQTTSYVGGVYTGTPQLIDLGSTAVSDLQGDPSKFAVGLLIDPFSIGGLNAYTSHNADPSELGEEIWPFLRVTYTEGGRRRSSVVFT